MTGDVTKLPKWAQSEICRLERDLATAYEKLTAGPEDSNTFADPYGEAERPLGDSPNIVFKWGDRHTERITVRLEGESLSIQGGDQIMVHPRASNSVYIKIGRFS